MKGSLPLQSHEATQLHNPCYDCQYGQSPQWLHSTSSRRSTDAFLWTHAMFVARRTENAGVRCRSQRGHKPTMRAVARVQQLTLQLSRGRPIATRSVVSLGSPHDVYVWPSVCLLCSVLNVSSVACCTVVSLGSVLASCLEKCIHVTLSWCS